jgi:succinate-acetate transporter protein
LPRAPCLTLVAAEVARVLGDREVVVGSTLTVFLGEMTQAFLGVLIAVGVEMGEVFTGGSMVCAVGSFWLGLVVVVIVLVLVWTFLGR